MTDPSPTPGIFTEWGEQGARQLATECDAIVVVDVLSFSTTVSVAVAAGLVVYPHRWRDDSASHRARLLGAALAGDRGRGPSLSPASLGDLEAGSSLLLPSPNGAACCLAATSGDAAVVAGSLRNAAAVATWLASQGFSRIGLLPGGWHRSPETGAAAASAAVRRPLREVLSGIELARRGFEIDVAMAEAVGADDVVPLLVDGAFQSA